MGSGLDFFDSSYPRDEFARVVREQQASDIKTWSGTPHLITPIELSALFSQRGQSKLQSTPAETSVCHGSRHNVILLHVYNGLVGDNNPYRSLVQGTLYSAPEASS